MVCLKPHLFEPFALVVGEMLEQIGDSGDRPDLVCGQVLARWRELLEKEPSRQIGQETIRGVFGELWHLREIVRGDPDGLRYWMGPTGARHDFSTGTVALEVKTTAARAGRVFEIHGHDQLEPPRAADSIWP